MNRELFLERLKRHQGVLFGRDAEVQKINRLWETRVVDDGKVTALFVLGYSGSGKSQLVRHVFGGTGANKSWLYAEGKYDQRRSARPYPDLTDICRKLCRVLLEQLEESNDKCHRITEEEEEPVETSQFPSSNIHNLVEELRQRLGKHYHLLVKIMPELATLLDPLASPEETSSGGAGTLQFDQLKAAFKNFFSAIGVAVPLVLFVDDIQWADAASLEIFDELLTEEPFEDTARLSLNVSESKNAMMIVFAYRDNELVGDHPLTTALRRIEGRSLSSRLHVTDLTEESLNLFIASLLKVGDTPHITERLSRAVHQRTHGNIFFVLQFVQMLVTSNILTHSYATMKWSWDDEKLLDLTYATENVTDLVVSRMRKLPEDTALALIIASQLGNRFDALMVTSIVGKWKEERSARDSSGSLLVAKDWDVREVKLELGETESDKFLPTVSIWDIAIQEGYIIAADAEEGGKWYKFLHDKIQQAAADLMDNEEERCALRLRLGTLLLDANKEKNKTWVKLVAVDLLNTVVDLILERDDSGVRLLELAQANVAAAKIASTQSAFFAAAEYLRMSRSLLQRCGDIWQDDCQYDFVLNVYSFLAEIAYCCGNSAECEEMYHIIRDNRKMPKDSWLASYNLMKALGSESRFGDCISLCYDVLNEAGFYMPEDGATHEDVARAYGQVSNTLQEITNDAILVIPDVKLNAVSSLIWRILSSAFLFVWHDNRPLDHAFMCCTMTLRTLNEGISFYTRVCQSLIKVVSLQNLVFFQWTVSRCPSH